LREVHGLDLMVPNAEDRTAIHDIIFNELCCGTVREESRTHYIDIIRRGRANGADSVILGCTEIGLLIGPEHVDLPMFDSTLIHADAAVRFSLGADHAPRQNAA
jgi:aspartate racemase